MATNILNLNFSGKVKGHGWGASFYTHNLFETLLRVPRINYKLKVVVSEISQFSSDLQILKIELTP